MGLPLAGPAAAQLPAAEAAGQQSRPSSQLGGSPSRGLSGCEVPGQQQQQQPPQQVKSRRKRKTSAPAPAAAAPAGSPARSRRVGVVWRDDGRQWEAAAMCTTPDGQRVAVRYSAAVAAAAAAATLVWLVLHSSVHPVCMVVYKQGSERLPL